MNVNEILKDIGQKQPEKKKKTAPRIQMIHYTKLRPNPSIFMKLIGIREISRSN